MENARQRSEFVFSGSLVLVVKLVLLSRFFGISGQKFWHRRRVYRGSRCVNLRQPFY